MHVLVIACGS